ncbi:MAG: hypothetical protein QOC83_3239 [Pseudonocardiales bacterium]|jgi:hypothetical protein|nr:hypothetical protein [Pseudonocardiales bacterium]MDT7638951.1 hypothetical protein [Pseudonocardiales bacterium]MDT7681393.1 hypothetical protein [Pseudonocardiales bacterium]
MNSVTTVIVIIIAVIVILAIGAAIYRLTQKRRSDRLHERFGPEYDRAVERADDRRGAESELLEREKRHKELELRTLDAGQQRQFEQRWSDVQRDFVDGPAKAVHHADRLVVDVMSARGYPVDDFDQRADDLSVKYPKVTQHYREARRIARANERGEVSTEELRTAVTSYRSLVDALLHDSDGPKSDSARTDSARTDSARRDTDQLKARRDSNGQQGNNGRRGDDPRGDDPRGDDPRGDDQREHDRRDAERGSDRPAGDRPRTEHDDDRPKARHGSNGQEGTV